MKLQLRFMGLLLTSNVGDFYNEKQIVQFFSPTYSNTNFSWRNCWLLHHCPESNWISGRAICRADPRFLCGGCCSTAIMYQTCNTEKTQNAKVFKRKSQLASDLKQPPALYVAVCGSDSPQTAVEQMSQKHVECLSSNLSAWKIKPILLLQSAPTHPLSRHRLSPWPVAGVSWGNRANAVEWNGIFLN